MLTPPRHSVLASVALGLQLMAPIFLLALASLPPASMASTLDPQQPTFELVVLCPDGWEEEAQRLADWKNRTGMSSIVARWPDLAARHEGADVPESIKRGVADLHSRFDFRYLLLLGDDHLFPVRYTITDRPAYHEETQELLAVGAYYACDLYYADLYGSDGGFQDWDIEGNGWYGELMGDIFPEPINHDRLDLYPDVAVGRAPASNLTELSYYIDKVISYESSGPDAHWMSNNLFALTTMDFSIFTETTIDSYYLWQGTSNLYGKPPAEIWRMVDESLPVRRNYSASPELVNDLIAKPGIGLLNFCGHGSTSSMDGIMTVSSLKDLNSSHHPVAFSTGCSTGRFTVEPPFDDYLLLSGEMKEGVWDGGAYSTSTYPPVPHWLQKQYNGVGSAIEIDGLAEYSTVRAIAADGRPAQGGLIAFFAGVSGMQEYVGELDRYFLEAYFSYDGREKILGDLQREMLDRYLSAHGFGGGEHLKTASYWGDIAAYHQPMKLHLFGDPSLRVGGLPQRPPSLEVVSDLPAMAEGVESDLLPCLSFHDPEGATALWRVDLDDDGEWDRPHGEPEWAPSLIVKIMDDYHGPISVQGSDGEYLTEAVRLEAVVLNVAPEPQVLPPTELVRGSSCCFLLGSGDTGRDTWNFTMDFGDGSGPETIISDSGKISMAHSYPRAGTYLVRLTVIDDDGGEGYRDLSVVVEDAAFLAPLRTFFDDHPALRCLAGFAAIALAALVSMGPVARMRRGPWARALALVGVAGLTVALLIALQVIPLHP